MARKLIGKFDDSDEDGIVCGEITLTFESTLGVQNDLEGLDRLCFPKLLRLADCVVHDEFVGRDAQLLRCVYSTTAQQADIAPVALFQQLE